MKRRIFIAIALPEELKAKINEAVKQWHWLPIRWLKPENWHITVVPPTYLEESEFEKLAKILKEGRLGRPFAVGFSRISLAPPGGKARMIWLEGETPPELTQLKKKIESLRLVTPSLPPIIEEENREARMHVTLARFESGELKEIEEKTRILGEIKLKFEVREIVMMESRLQSSGAEYIILERMALV